MIEIKFVWVQFLVGGICLWVLLNMAVFVFNVIIFWGDDDQLERTPLIATGLWVGIVLCYVLAYFVKIVP